MTVQIQPTKPKDEHNGLADIEGDLLAHPADQVVAIVTYSVKKITEDVETGDRYPVLKMKHIEPLDGEQREAALELQRQAFAERTGAEELDLDITDGDE